MNINKPNHKKRNIIITFAVVLLLGIAAYSAVAYARGYWPFLLTSNTQDTKDTESKIDYKKPTTEQIKAGNQTKDQFLEKETEASKQQAKATGTETKQPAKTNTSVLISSLNLNGSSLSARTIIQAIDASGTCKFALTKPGQKPIELSAGTQTQASYSVCQGFDIETASLARGEWKVSITYTGSAGQSGSAEKTVTLP